MFVVIKNDLYYSGLIRSRPVWVKDFRDAMIYDQKTDAQQVADSFKGTVKPTREICL